MRSAPKETVEVPAGSVGFTLCGTPIILRPGGDDRITRVGQDGERSEIAGAELPAAWSRRLFDRTAGLQAVYVEVALSHARQAGR